jgi:hypothetical protein
VTRDQYKTVTSKESFAILIPASEWEAEGEATFQMELGGPQHVRAATLKEMRKTAKELKGAIAAHFDALLAMRGALESRDELALSSAKDRLERAYGLWEAERPLRPLPEEEESRRQLGEALASVVGMSATESLKHFEGLGPGPQAKADIHRLLSYEVSSWLGRLQTPPNIVLWWMNGSFRPAIYCGDTKTALYVHTFFIAPVGGLGFRICPYDGKQFFQGRPNQEYCCPAHREAHRVARFRDNRRRNHGERGKRHGAQKTR